jgi:ubiquinone/menaquinone biosynthesis C-methylase UbiE
LKNFIYKHKNVRAVANKTVLVYGDVYASLVDFEEHLSGKHNVLIPPYKMRGRLGAAKDYRLMAEEYYKIFLTVCDLKPSDCVLDVGCGTGRLAYLLTNYLVEGSYYGFDIKESIVNWCKKTFEPRFPNFHFQYVDVRSNMYNPTGKIKSSLFKFPFDSNKFDFVFLASVFTHMLPADMENYLTEISRVLKPNSRCLISYIIKRTGKDTSPSFPFFIGNGCWVSDKNHLEGAVAYEENYLRLLYQKKALQVIEPIYYGRWCREKSKPLTIQDLVLAKKG